MEKQFYLLLITLAMFAVYNFIHFVVVKRIYCKWKMKGNSRYRCHYWNCKKFKDCEFNGEKHRFFSKK